MAGSDKKLWGGRFEKPSADITERLSASIHYDARLYRQDIRGSIAHANMLAKCGIFTAAERNAIVAGLRDIEGEIAAGTFRFERSREDIHMNIEAALTERIGEPGRKLHTARSRNDQVALDARLYLRDEITEIDARLARLIERLADLAERHIDVVMPGYTHLQVAQPVRLGQHLLAHAWAFVRDRRRLAFARGSADELPLGVGALAGVNYPNDRDMLRDELGFSGITANSMDTVADRDFALDFLYAAAALGMHLSRFCEELVLWSSAEFNFIRLADGVTTGSSIMPQKRNPDLAELIRGKSGRLYGNLVSLLTTMKGLPLAYNRDMQEDKEPLFDSVDTVKLALEGMIEMLADVTVNTGAMRSAIFRNFSTATDLADYLAKKGVPFREAHEITGRVVAHCERNGIDFFSLTPDTLATISPEFGPDAVALLSPDTSPERKVSAGGTARDSIAAQIAAIRARVGEEPHD